MIKLVIFDFDGTMVDTAADIISATHEFRAHYGLTDVTDHDIRMSIGTGLRDLLYKVFHSESEERLNLYESHFMDIYERHHLLQAKAFEGLDEFLKNWPGKRAILSNKSERFIHSILTHLKLDRMNWVDVVGGDTYAEKKPHPLPFEKILQKAGVRPEETLMVGDGEPDIIGAINAEILPVAAAYGYAPLEKLQLLGAEHSIRHLRELLPLIESLESR
jgi:phosphoglycolate phosphatase